MYICQSFRIAVCIYLTSPPQSHLGRACCYPHIGECTVPLYVLAVACKMRNEVLWKRYGMLWKHYGTIPNITECHCMLWNLWKCYGVLQIIMEHYGALRDITRVTERYWSISELLQYGTLWNHYGNINFAPH